MFQQVIIISAGCLCITVGQIKIQRQFEFEDVLTAEQEDFWVWRSEASRHKNLRLKDMNQTYLVEFTLCLEPFNASQSISVTVDDIRYSNDGPSDTVLLTIDNQQFGQFNTTESRGGHTWNVFRNSGQIASSITLSQGQHALQIRVITDKWGVELDTIRITAENQDSDKDLFCRAYLI